MCDPSTPTSPAAPPPPLPLPRPPPPNRCSNGTRGPSAPRLSSSCATWSATATTVLRTSSRALHSTRPGSACSEEMAAAAAGEAEGPWGTGLVPLADATLPEG